jgi:hypothetical protein
VFVKKGQPVPLPKVSGCPAKNLPSTLHPIDKRKNI